MKTQLSEDECKALVKLLIAVKVFFLGEGADDQRKAENVVDALVETMKFK